MDSFSSTLKSVGAFVLTAILFVGLGYYVYTALIVQPVANKPADEFAAVHTTAPAQPVEKTTADAQRKPS